MDLPHLPQSGMDPIRPIQRKDSWPGHLPPEPLPPAVAQRHGGSHHGESPFTCLSMVGGAPGNHGLSRHLPDNAMN